MEKDTLTDDRDDFKLCLDAESEQRKVSQDDLEFVLLDKQWHEDDESSRKAEGRPCLTINKLKAFGKQVTNDGRLNRPSINVKPVGSGADKETADIHSDLIRNIETQSQSAIVYDTAFHFAVYGGLGYFRINVDYTCEDEWDQDISLSRISNPFSVYGDYESKEATSIDWNRCYVTDFYSKAAFEAKWGKDKKASSFEDGGKDYGADWFKDDRIRVAERWLREEVPVTLLKLSNGSIMMEPEYERNLEAFEAQQVTVDGTRESRTYKVKQRIITGTEILEENDWVGKYIPIVPMYGEEINIAGKRYFRSLIHSAKDSQRLFNYQRTLSAELGGLQPRAPWLGPVGMFNTDQNWSTANRINHPYLQYDVVSDQPGATPQRIPFAGPPAGAMQEAMMASDDMKAIVGLYDASLGKQSNETSGRAINARDRQGDIATFDFVDNRNRAVEHGGRIILDLIPKVYSTERIMRCVQEDSSTYTIPVNQPVAPRRDVEQIMGQQPDADGEQDQPTGPPEYVPIPQGIEQQVAPEMLEKLKAVTKVFDLTVGKYDVVVTAGPGFNTRREEASQQMMEFIRIFPQAAPLIGDLLAKNLDRPGAEQVAERLKAMLPPQAQGKVPPIVQQLQQQLQQQDQAAKQAVQQLSAQGQELQKQLADKRREDGVREYDAQTKRMSEVTDAAQAGFTVVPHPELGFVAMPMQQQTGLPKEPPPEVLIEANLKHREYDIKDKELSLKERQVDSAVNAETVNTQAQQFSQIALPAQLMEQNAANNQAVLQALSTLAAAVQQKPISKTGRAVRQPDGSFLMDCVECPMPDVKPPEGA